MFENWRLSACSHLDAVITWTDRDCVIKEWWRFPPAVIRVCNGSGDSVKVLTNVTIVIIIFMCLKIFQIRKVLAPLDTLVTLHIRIIFLCQGVTVRRGDWMGWGREEGGHLDGRWWRRQKGVGPRNRCRTCKYIWGISQDFSVMFHGNMMF